MNINQFKENLEVAILSLNNFNYYTGKIKELYISLSGYKCATIQWHDDKFWTPEKQQLLSNLLILN